MTTDLRFTVEMRTTGSNAREHFRVAAARVAKERDAVAATWLRYREGIARSGMFVPNTVERIPRGTSTEARKLAKKTGASLRIPEYVLRPCVRLRVELIRVSPRTLDAFDNLPHALKGCVDELAWQMGITDRDPIVTWAKPEQEKGPQKYYAVRVRIVVAEAARGAT